MPENRNLHIHALILFGVLALLGVLQYFGNSNGQVGWPFRFLYWQSQETNFDGGGLGANILCWIFVVYLAMLPVSSATSPWFTTSTLLCFTLAVCLSLTLLRFSGLDLAQPPFSSKFKLIGLISLSLLTSIVLFSIIAFARKFVEQK